jgi:hypothetical protein
MGSLATPAYAILKTADGAWQAVRSKRSELAILDSTGNVMATSRHAEVALASDETLPWLPPSLFGRRYR